MGVHPFQALQRLNDMGRLSSITIIGDNPKAALTAAWLANCGYSVHLLGVLAKSTFDLEPLAHSHLYLPEFQPRLKVGLVRDNLDALRRSEWIHDCHSSNADVKDPLFSVIDTAIAPGAVMTTDDTLLPLANFISKLSPILAKRTFVLQFAEPVSRSELADYALTKQTEASRAESLLSELHKTAGVFRLQSASGIGLTVQRATLLYCMLAISAAERLQLDVDQADRFAETLGLLQPFRRVDASVFNDTVTSCLALCQEYGLPGLPRSLRALYDNPRHSHGFYSSETGQSVVLDLQTLAYRGSTHEPDRFVEKVRRLPLVERMPAALASPGPLGEFAREINKIFETIVSQLRKRPGATDEALQLALRYGIGVRTSVPGSAFGVSEAVSEDVLRVPFCMNSQAARELTGQIASLGGRPFILAGGEDGFCMGIDYEEVLTLSTEEGREGLTEYVRELRQLVQALQSARCVAAVHGVCSGFGLEMALACDAIVADADAKMGLDYSKYGLMPFAGGSVRLRLLGQSEGAKHTAELCRLIATGFVSDNAYQARKLGLIPRSTEILVNRRRLIEAAQDELSKAHDKKNNAWIPIAGPLPGLIDQIKNQARQKGEISQHGELLMDKAKALMTKPSSIETALDLEAKTFVELAGKALSQARMRYTISTGKTLNN